MTKHVIDGPRARGDRTRLERYAQLDRAQSDAPGAQSASVLRSPKTRDSGKKLQRFARIDRRSDV